MLLAGVTLLGLTAASCARVQSHYVLPQLEAGDPSFLPTVEAYTTTALAGNSVDVLLNGDEIFPAALAAIRSARTTITYAQYFYEEGRLASSSRRRWRNAAGPESAPISCSTASAPS